MPNMPNMNLQMSSSGQHFKKVNGRPFKDQKFDLHINPYKKGRIFLKTQELKDGKHKLYKNAFSSLDDFMKEFENNNNSLFELNKNITRPRYFTPKYSITKPRGRRRGKPMIRTKDKYKGGPKRRTRGLPKRRTRSEPIRRTRSVSRQNSKKKFLKKKK